ncbi:hypothetical protein B9Z19DRAFT_1084195 [Tuber borchii]|uniref:Uncharacterized protein n=1 Tax=Tuber borchii TaxID=42251 RepID=A0A2T6ZSB4_TUBBO|nr:hypothetical protein B9Z19DRAFT_1084195 [Tuber borchii]
MTPGPWRPDGTVGNTAHITDFNGQSAPLPSSHHERPQLSDLKDSVSKPTDGGLSTKSLWSSRPFPVRPLKLWHPPRKTDAHPNTQSILSFAVGRSFIIASLICLFAFLLYIVCATNREARGLGLYEPNNSSSRASSSRRKLELELVLYLVLPAFGLKSGNGYGGRETEGRS